MQHNNLFKLGGDLPLPESGRNRELTADDCLVVSESIAFAQTINIASALYPLQRPGGRSARGCEKFASIADSLRPPAGW